MRVCEVNQITVIYLLAMQPRLSVQRFSYVTLHLCI